MSGQNTAFHIFRNCFTGEVSGGDIHLDKFIEYLHKHYSSRLSLIHAQNDGQLEVYPSCKFCIDKSYRIPLVRTFNPAALYLARAIMTLFVPRLSLKQQNVFIAGSHFLPDVLPVAFRGLNSKSTRVVYIHHLISEMDRPRSVWNEFALLQERLCLWIIRKRFDRIITVSASLSKRLKDSKFGNLEILTSSNPVDTNGQSVLPYAEKDIDIIFCGRFVKQKGVLDFVRVAESLACKDSSLRAVMIGTGPEAVKVERELHEKGVKIDLMGYLPDSVKLNLISRSKLFVFPSLEEGWGISVAESLKLGTPVLAYDLPIYKEVFAGNLYTVPFAEVAQLAQKSSEILEHFKNDRASYAAQQQKLVAFTAKYDTGRIMRAENTFMLEGF